MGSGYWMSNYDDSVISDAEYQALQANWASPYADIRPTTMTESGMVERPGTVELKAPAAGKTFEQVIDEIMKSGVAGANDLATLANIGYFNQFPGGAEKIAALGPWIASRQSEFADRHDALGINGFSQDDFAIVRLILSAVGGAAIGSGTEAGTDAALAGGGEVGSGYAASAPGAAPGAGSAAFAPSEIGFESAPAGVGSPSEVGFETGTAATGSTSAPTPSGGVSANGGPGLVEATGGAAGGTALSKLLDGSASASDFLELAGKLAGPAIGAIASNRQANSFEDLANKYMDFGAPSRARYEASYAPGFSMDMDPGYKDALDSTTKSFLHKASVTGNPVDSPNAWQQTLTDVNSKFAYPALQDYRKTNASSGGLATFAAAAPGMETSAINSTRGIYDSIGAGAADIFNPPKSMVDLMRELRRGGYA